MSAPGITYEGALAKDGGGGGSGSGNVNGGGDGLFKNMTFWVAHRIPNRLTCVRNIVNNGGKVVPLEKKADYLIADPAKKDAPLGSYSYAFITDSIEEGSLRRLEDYLCASPPPSQASVGKPQKGTRTPFTQEDDSMLARWVTKCERRGEAVSGNEIYKAFAARYPHHTSQSWRDRWVKRLKFLPHPEVSDTEPSPPPSQLPAQSMTRPPPSQNGASPQRPSTARPASTQNPGRAKFSEEDDQILLEHIGEAIMHDKPLSGNKIYQELAADFPQHTSHSWRDRWLRVLQPKYRHSASGRDPEARLERRMGQPGRLRTDNEGRSEDTPEQQQVPEMRAPASARTSTASQAVRARHAPIISKDSVGSSNIDQDESQPSPEMIIAPPFRAQDEESAIGSPTPDRSSPSIRPNESPSEKYVIEVGTKENFYRDYNNCMDALGVQANVPWRSIGGKAVELWDLWRAVVSKKMAPAERDWQLIAEDLGFNWVERETIPDEIRQCYEDNIGRYEEIVEHFYTCNDDDDEEDEDDAEEDFEEPLPSSPPIMPSLKRTFAMANDLSDHVYPGSTPKRRKLDRDSEIPSTPDEMNGTSHLRRQADGDITPSARSPKVAKARTSATQHHAPLQVTGEDEDDEWRDEPQELPVLPRARKPAVEPETQNFRFDPDTQKLVFDEPADDPMDSQITPSQQLRQESDARSSEMLANSPPTTPTPRRVARTPFRQDLSDGETPKANRSRNNGRLSADPKATHVKRRSLPTRWSRNQSHEETSPKTTTHQRDQSVSRKEPSPEPKRTPVKETPDDIIDRFLAFGYPHDIVVRALKATTWHIGNAGQVMEMMKQGEGIPQKISGVWTQRDDESLMLVDSKAPPKDAKEERKREKQLRRLQAKHGADAIATRRKYLAA